MEYVEPIRDLKKLDLMKKFLKNQSKRDYLLFVMGINSGLRISDILELKTEDVIDEKGNPKQHYKIRESKTGKFRQIPFPDGVKKAIKDFIKEYNPSMDEYLFKSRKGANQPIKRQTAWKILKDAAETVGIQDSIGTHSLRKTMAYHAYKNGTDISLLQTILNHSSPGVTLRYIGITQEDINDVFINLDL
ncbi:site-specific integrase [Peribacillus frigoritolerans]|uniref:site-specific integrase n=1 Tax=Peribacillus frigoritolerans TaxID=450367 RepID=UPI0021D09ABB|nr:site-specific integrase [Peribacillus frigoritolerans]MCU6603836.1 site-specific integrase [Peribacillus frigoritolerans]